MLLGGMTEAIRVQKDNENLHGKKYVNAEKLQNKN